jgi:hypothetical protein
LVLRAAPERPPLLLPWVVWLVLDFMIYKSQHRSSAQIESLNGGGLHRGRRVSDGLLSRDPS